MKLLFKKTEDRESANKKFYRVFTTQFSWFLESGKKSRIRAHACYFVLSEILDNLYEHDSSFVAAKVEIDVDYEDGSASVKLKHDGSEFNPFADGSPCKKIKENIYKLGCEPTVLDSLKGSSGIEMIFKFKFDLNLDQQESPYKISSTRAKDTLTIKIEGDLVRGWGLEANADFSTLLMSAKKEAQSNVIIFDLRNLSFWDTMGCSKVLELVKEINSKHDSRAKVWADESLKDYAGHYEEEIVAGIIKWVNPDENPV